MTKRMTRNLILFLCFLIPSVSFATPESPVVQGLAGAGRAGNPREALFANPASVAFVNGTYGFLHYVKPRIPDLNAGGRSYNVGVYDGGNPEWKGAFGYLRESRAVLLDGRQTYVDRSEYRFSTAHIITGNFVMGAQFRYTANHRGDEKVRFGEGDVGAIFPLFGDLRAGATLENIANRENDKPLTVGVGANYPLGYGFNAYADGYQLMKGTRKDRRGYAIALEYTMSDFVVRAGRYLEGFRKLKGWSMGLSWGGPRASFDYAIRFAGDGPKERDHIFGMTVSF